MSEKRAGALEGPRQFTVMIPEYQSIFRTPALGWTPYKTWNHGTTARGLRCLINETYVDLQGFHMDELTFFPSGGMIQDPGVYKSDDDNTPVMEIYDIVSQERLDVDELAENMVLNSAPGMLGVFDADPSTTIDYQNIVFGKYRLLMNTAEYNETGTKTYLSARQSEFGSAEPISVQKLWCYRFVRFLVNDGKALFIPASRFIIQGIVDKEKELVYLQRLKRQYETQGKL